MQRIAPREWNFSNKALLDCIDAIKKKVKVSREFDIPLLAGYSEDGSMLYVDKEMPEGYASKSGQYVHAINFLLFHEGVEKALIDQYKIGYEVTHEVALRVEEDAVKAAGINSREYNGFMEKWIKRCRDKKNYKLPRDLDMKPYAKEMEILRKLGQ